MELPMLLQSMTDSRVKDPNAHSPVTDRELPMRMYERSERADPSDIMSKADVAPWMKVACFTEKLLLPFRIMPLATESPLPHRMNDRKERTLPHWRVSRTDSRFIDWLAICERTESDDPRCTLARMLQPSNVLPTRSAALRLQADPHRANARSEIELPNAMKPRMDAWSPVRAKLRSDMLEASATESSTERCAFRLHRAHLSAIESADPSVVIVRIEREEDIVAKFRMLTRFSQRPKARSETLLPRCRKSTTESEMTLPESKRPISDMPDPTRQ
mmetsp:Transcript_3491/g.8250  ORF Transcript_3491/g.8250 Transcript_3491/m.8250 type:complete len:274 (+) Transcript_3491:72-893(+)